jgi:hypothetical protein
MVLIAHAFGHLDLVVEGHLVLAAVGDQVQVAAHGPEKPLGRVEGGEFLGSEHAEFHEFVDPGTPCSYFAIQ